MSQESENYLVDLGEEILAGALRAKRDAKCSPDGFEQGRLSAYYEILSLMKRQSAAFGLDESAIGLKGVDLDQLL